MLLYPETLVHAVAHATGLPTVLTAFVLGCLTSYVVVVLPVRLAIHLVNRRLEVEPAQANVTVHTTVVTPHHSDPPNPHS